jgi:NADH dehydrogenase FAD-containing subunit
VLNQYPGSAPDGDVVSVKVALDRRRKNMKTSKRIVIAGGGAVGLELSGEIKTDYPDKEVTVIHPYDKPLGKDQSNLFSDAFLNKILGNLDAVGIKIILGERVELPNTLPDDGMIVGEQIVRTNKGKEIAADLLITCIGNRSLPRPFEKHMADSIDKWGYLNVHDDFQVMRGDGGVHEGVFAIGDCTSRAEPKTAANSQSGGVVAAENIVIMAENEAAGYDVEQRTPLKSRAPGAAAAEMILAVGRKGGASQSADGKVSGAEVVSKMKSGTMYTQKMWKMFGIDDPNAALQSSSRKTVVGLEASEMWNAVQKEAEEAKKLAAAGGGGGPAW